MSAEAKSTTANEVKFSLKILVNPKAKKVIFAEAKKDFVDFLFHILSLPISTVVKLLKNEEAKGSLQSLYKSVESLQTEYFLPNANCDTVLLPKHPISLPLLSIVHHNPATLTHFKCPDHNYVTDRSGQTCSCNVYCYPTSGPCKKPMSQVTFTYVAPSSSNVHPGFVKEAIPYIVTDNLEVKPMSLTLIKSLVTDFDYLVEDDVQFGHKEGLALLRAFMETKDVLTTIFLGNKMKTGT
ncbi:uncharacterized protein LOC141631631 [Silene latifolia]|uniref:uncharacterized protein LOC141631631 n=1 Tax=Silene latifolia TaxID=37657 RepID=UPI003D76E3C5